MWGVFFRFSDSSPSYYTVSLVASNADGPDIYHFRFEVREDGTLLAEVDYESPLDKR
jgi:hypothetical protein